MCRSDRHPLPGRGGVTYVSDTPEAAYAYWMQARSTTVLLRLRSDMPGAAKVFAAWLARKREATR